MAIISIPAFAWERGLNYKEIGWHASIHMLGFAGIAWMFVAFDPRTCALVAAMFLYGHLSIRTGTHSLYTHQAYEAAFAWHAYKVIGYMLTLQGPIRIWCALHNRHHKRTDTDEDPYSPVHGFWWSHMLWRFFNLPRINFVKEVPWLYRRRSPESQRLVKLLEWSERNHMRIGLLVAVGLPTVIASLWGDPVGGFLISFARLMLQYHLTWQINSISHTFGSRKWSPDSSRDAPWWLYGVSSLTSVGESTRHNWHHRWPRGAFIGDRLFDIDPGKWELYTAWFFSRPLIRFDLPLVWNLHRYDDDGTLRLLA